MTKPIVPVMFRTSKDDSRDVFALFPTLPGTNQRHTCTCYQHVGQHSSADLNGCLASSRPARYDEYKDLLSELAGIYDDCELRLVKRSSRKMDRERYAELDRSRCA